MSIGAAIREIRISKAMSQKHLAELIGLSQNKLSLIENGQSIPHKTTLKLICDALEVPVSLIHLFALDGNDLPEVKRDAFRVLFHLMKELILMEV